MYNEMEFFLLLIVCDVSHQCRDKADEHSKIPFSLLSPLPLSLFIPPTLCLSSLLFHTPLPPLFPLLPLSSSIPKLTPSQTPSPLPPFPSPLPPFPSPLPPFPPTFFTSLPFSLPPSLPLSLSPSLPLFPSSTHLLATSIVPRTYWRTLARCWRISFSHSLR